MTECQQCGSAAGSEERFCGACGVPLEALLPPEPALAGAWLGVEATPRAALLDRPSLDRPSLDRPSTVPPPAPSPRASVPAAALPPPSPIPTPPRSTPPSAPREVAARIPTPPKSGSAASSEPRTLVGFLVSYDAVPLGQYWPLHQGRNVVGRLGAAPALDVEISHPTTSSRHAVLTASARPARVMIEDIGSTNGTFVNEAALPPGQRRELEDGDRVRFGLFSAVVKLVRG